MKNNSITMPLMDFSGHTNQVMTVAYSPDGRYVVSGDRDSTVRLWEIKSGKLIRVFRHINGEIMAVAVSADGRYIVSGGRNGHRVCIWEVETGHLLHKLEDFRNEIKEVAISKSGEYVAGATGGRVYAWDVKSGNALIDKLFPGNEVKALGISPNGQFVASGGDLFEGRIGIWSTDTGKLIHDLRRGEVPVVAVAISSDGNWLTYATATGSIHKKNLLKGAYHSRNGPPGSEVISTTVIDQDTGKEILYIRSDHYTMKKISLTSNGRYAVSSYRDEKILVMDLNTETIIGTINSPKTVWSVDISLDGKYVISSGDTDGTIYVWELASGNVIQEFKGAKKQKITTIGVSPDWKYLTMATGDNTINVLEMASQKIIHKLEGHSSEVRSIIFSPDGLYLASGGLDRKVRIWNIKTGLLYCTLENGNIEHGISRINFSPDGSYVIASSYSQFVCVWEMETGKHMPNLLSGSDLTAIALSVGAKKAVGIDKFKTLVFWDIPSDERYIYPYRYEFTESDIKGVEFLDNGKIIRVKHKDRFEHIPVKSLSFPKKREEYGYSYITKLKFKKSEPVKAQIEISRIAENILLTIPEETNELPETIKQLIHSHTSSSPNWIALSPYSFLISEWSSNEQKEENYKEDPTILESGDFDLEKITRISTFYNQQKVYLEANEFLYRKVAGLYLQVFPLSEIAMSGIVLKAIKEWEEENKKWGSGIFKIGVIGRFSEERKNGFILLNSLVKDHLIDILIDKSKIQLIDKKLNEALGLLI